MPKRDRKSLKQVYLYSSVFPFCGFVLISMLMFFARGQLADPVLKGNEVFALMILPSVSSAGIAIAALANSKKQRIKASVINLLAFLVSFICLPMMFLLLCLTGMKF